MRFEAKYHVHYRTKYFHSLFGAIVMSLPVLLFSAKGALFFFIAYLIHLLLDWPDIDEKYYLWPFNIKFKGFLPIFSNFEKVFTVFLAVLYYFLTK